MSDIKKLLEAVRDGVVSIDDALLQIKKAPFDDIGYAKVDHHRKLRQGMAEVIYGAGKTPEQILGIVENMLQNDQERILITRMSQEAADYLVEKINQVSASTQTEKAIDFEYYKDGRIGIIGGMPDISTKGTIVVACGGTSDIPVAEEAALTARVYGNEVIRLYDVGVAGLHRLLSHMDDIMKASVIISIAGMEGALTSVIGGLADCPVISVPTSVGYGAAFDGLAALLSMLNSCASGVSVVNIDNGFGAGYLASMINQR